MTIKVELGKIPAIRTSLLDLTSKQNDVPHSLLIKLNKFIKKVNEGFEYLQEAETLCIDEFSTGKGQTIGNQFFPIYETPEKKKLAVERLKEIAKTELEIEANPIKFSDLKNRKKEEINISGEYLDILRDFIIIDEPIEENV